MVPRKRNQGSIRIFIVQDEDETIKNDGKERPQEKKNRTKSSILPLRA